MQEKNLNRRQRKVCEKKVMLSLCWSVAGAVYCGLFSHGATVTADVYSL